MTSPERPVVGVGVIVVREGKLLLGRRKSSHGRGHYSSGGGHLEYMEGFETAVRRELKEETGLEVSELRFLCVINLKQYAPKHYIDIGFIANWQGGEAKVVEPDKFESWDWYDLNALPEPLFGAIPYYLEAYKTGKQYFDM